MTKLSDSVPNEISLAKRFLTALGVNPDSPLMAPESWISWSTMVVFASVGLANGPTLSVRLGFWLGLATLASAALLAALTSYVLPLREHVGGRISPRLGGFWLSAEAIVLRRKGLPLATVIERLGFVSSNVFTLPARAAARATSAVLLATLCLGLGGLTRSQFSRQPDVGATAARLVEKMRHAIDAGLIAGTGQPPAEVDQARSAFETAWRGASLAQRQGVPASALYGALAVQVEYYRLREANDNAKPASFFWADEAVRYFREISDSPHLVQSYCNKAAILTDMVGLYNASPTQFRTLSQTGRDVMADAATVISTSEIPSPMRARVLRLTSTFNYDLARPGSGNLADRWDNTFLEVAFRRIREAQALQPDDSRNAIQLARTAQRLLRNNRHNPSLIIGWHQQLREAQSIMRSTWQRETATRTEPRSRLGPLNNLAVLELEMAIFQWGRLEEERRRTEATSYLADLDSIAIPAQQEARTLLGTTELRGSFAFDIAFDLSRLYALRTQLGGYLPAVGRASMDDVATYLSEALRNAAPDQRLGVGSDLVADPAFSGLTEEERQRLQDILHGI